LRSCQLCSHSRTSKYTYFMGPEGSLPCSQETPPPPNPILSQIDPAHTIPSYLSKMYIILSIRLRLVLPSGVFPSGFSTNTLYAFLFSPFVLHALPISSSLTYHSVWRGVQVMKLLIMQFSPTSCHFVSLRSEYSPQAYIIF
jgi:hypothetical protein